MKTERGEEWAEQQQMKKILEMHLPVSAEIERELKREEKRLETIAPGRRMRKAVKIRRRGENFRCSLWKNGGAADPGLSGEPVSGSTDSW